MSDQLPQPGVEAEASVDISRAVAILAPRGRDAAVAAQLLAKDNIAALPVGDLDQLAAMVGQHVGAVLVTEEALAS